MKCWKKRTYYIKEIWMRNSKGNSYKGGWNEIFILFNSNSVKVLFCSSSALVLVIKNIPEVITLYCVFNNNSI